MKNKFLLTLLTVGSIISSNELKNNFTYAHRISVSSVTDAEKYNVFGYDVFGYDSMGYDRSGHDSMGYDRWGRDKWGKSKY